MSASSPTIPEHDDQNYNSVREKSYKDQHNYFFHFLGRGGDKNHAELLILILTLTV